MRNLSFLFLLLSLLLVSACSPKEIRYRIGVSQCSDDEWRNKMNKEIKREALFYDGVEIDIRTSKDDNQTQIADIEDLLDEGIDLLVVAPNEAEAIAPAVEQALAKGIPVIVVDRKIASDNYTAYIGADNYEIGRTAGEYIISRLGGKGTVVEITGLTGSTPAMERHRGMMDALTKAPDIRIVGKIEGDWLQDEAEHQMERLLLEGVEADLVFAQNDRMAYGAYLAAQEQGKADDITFVGVDALSGEGYGLNQVRDGLLDATFIYPTGGDRVLQTAMNILKKQPYDKETILATALVDKGNARLMQMQTAEITAQDEKLERLNGQIDEYWSRYSVQTFFLYACIICLILFAGLMTMIVRAYWMKNRMNLELSSQKHQLEKQRDQLISLQDQLEKATQAKLVFFTNISHDIRTPLTLIADPVEQLLENDRLDAKQSALLGIVHKNVNILLRLVNQILDFRKFENDKLELKPVAVLLDAALKDWAQIFQPLALKKHIHFKQNIIEADYALLVDVDKMERIYFNLLYNAMKFTPENGSVEVELSKVERAGVQYISLTVADTGKGISTEHMKHIFDRFYQTEINPTGSGIGLALVKALVELQKGTINVDSTPGEGTRFVIELPVTPAVISHESNSYKPIDADAIAEELTDVIVDESQNDGNKECILIIDDNQDVRQYVATLLRSNYTVLEADNGQLGLQMAMRYVPDAVICDIMMPVMDGLECCRLLKSELQTSHIPVVLLTACALDEQRVAGLDSGADSYIAKPFNSKVLLASVRNLIRNRQQLKQFFGDHQSIKKEAVSELDKSFAERFRELIEKRLSDPALSVETLGNEMGLSRVQLYRKIKSLTNYSPVELLRIARLKRAASLLASTEKSISEVAYEVGFTTPSYFTKCYTEYFGENPTALVKKKKG